MSGKIRAAMLVFLCTGILVADDQSDEQKALEFFAKNAGSFGLTQNDVLKRRAVRHGANGENHIRFDRYYKGVLVFEGEAIAHLNTLGAISVTDTLGGAIDLDVQPTIQEGLAKLAVARALGMSQGEVISSALEILTQGERSAETRLAWHMKAFSDANGTPRSYDIFMDAKNGQVIWGFDSLETSAFSGVGNTMFAGQVILALDQLTPSYFMRIPAFSNLETRDMNNGTSGNGVIFSNNSGIFGNSQKDLSDRSTAGADAHFGMGKTWEYFQTTFGRNGINGAGRASFGRVHYSSGYENAFWDSSCFCMTYGDGASTFYPLVSIDVTGHEMAHGVMASEANLTYSGESGGLNESSSDIFGTLVEFYVNSPVDTPEYWIGERIYRSNWSGSTYNQTKALRYMDDPAKDGRSPACYTRSLRFLDVHYSSGPSNHMFYLLSNGGTSKCNGNTVSGIGRSKAALIWYDAISNFMTASTKYAGARTACINAATARYGAASPEVAAVASAFSAINVN